MTGTAMEQDIFLSPSAQDVLGITSGLIVISGEESSGKSTTLSLLSAGFRAMDKVPVHVGFGLHNEAVDSHGIMLPFLDVTEDADLVQEQGEVIAEAFAHIEASALPYVFIVDDVPLPLIRQMVSLAEAGYPVVVSLKASSALMAADKLCSGYGVQGFVSPVQSVLAVSIWQQLLTLTNGKKLLKSYAV